MCINSDETIVNMTTAVLSPVVLMSEDLTLGKTLQPKQLDLPPFGNLYGLSKKYTRIKKASLKGTLFEC